MLRCKANLPTPDCGEGKYRFIARPNKEKEQLFLKRPKFLNSYQGIIWGEGCSSWYFFWLVGGEVTGWCLGNFNHQVPTSLGSTCCGQHVVAILHLRRGLSSCRMTQRYTSKKTKKIYIRLLCKSLEEELALCFIAEHCFNYHYFSCLTAFPLFLLRKLVTAWVCFLELGKGIRD